jgi:hypothetical protein
MAAAPQSNVGQAAADAISTLRARSSSADELARCSQLLADMDNVSDAAAMSAVVGAMQTHPTHAALQRGGCKALSSLAFHSAAHRAKAGAVGGVDAVASAMRAFPADKQLQLSACFALANVTDDNAQNRVHASAAGAVPAVVAVLKACGDCTDVEHAGCAALTNLLHGNMGNVAAAVQAGAIDAVVAVLRGRGASTLRYASACSALSNLAVSEATQCNIADAGGIEAVLAVLRAHVADAMVSTNACSALGNIFGGGDFLSCARASSLAADAAVGVVAALNAHRGSAGVQQHGCFALCNIARGDAPPQCPNNVVHVHAAGGISAVVAALRAHPSDTMIQMHGCDAVAVMCGGVDSVTLEAGAAGAVEVVARAMHTLASHGSEMQRGCCRAMRQLVESGTANRAKAAAAGAAEALVLMMQSSADSEDLGLHSEACFALTLITLADAGKADVPGGVEAVVATLRRGTQKRARDAAAAAAAAAAVAAANNGGDGQVDESLEAAMLAALLSLIREHAGRQERAVRAGGLEAVLAAVESDAVMGDDFARTVHGTLLPLLHEAAQRHDAAGGCTQPEGCTRCAGMRARGAMCALPACCARQRAALTESGNTSLLRCGRCRLVAYCGAAHQHDDWARHKAECRRRAHADET